MFLVCISGNTDQDRDKMIVSLSSIFGWLNLRISLWKSFCQVWKAKTISLLANNSVKKKEERKR